MTYTCASQAEPQTHGTILGTNYAMTYTRASQAGPQTSSSRTNGFHPRPRQVNGVECHLLVPVCPTSQNA